MGRGGRAERHRRGAGRLRAVPARRPRRRARRCRRARMVQARGARRPSDGDEHGRPLLRIRLGHGRERGRRRVLVPRGRARGARLGDVQLRDDARARQRRGRRSRGRARMVREGGGARPREIDQPDRRLPRRRLGRRGRPRRRVRLLPARGRRGRLSRPVQLCALLAERGRVAEALEWLARVPRTATPAFVAKMRAYLAASPIDAFRALAARQEKSAT